MPNQPEPQFQERPPPYAAVLVRCWREEGKMRFLLENVQTRERQGFTTFEALSEALRIALLVAQSNS